MTKREDLNAALKESLKTRDQISVSTIRLILAALKDRDINARGHGNADGIPDSEILALLQSMVKQRHESSRLYREGNRPDLAEREDAEIAIIQTFLPKQMDESEIADAVSEIVSETQAQGVKDMGKVMAALKDRFTGQIDMAVAGKVVKDALLQSAD